MKISNNSINKRIDDLVLVIDTKNMQQVLKSL